MSITKIVQVKTNKLIIDYFILLLRVVKPFVIRFFSGVANDCPLPPHLLYCASDPRRNVKPRWQACRAVDDGIRQEPIVPRLSDAVFKWLVKANVDGLAEGCAATRDVLHLHP